MARDDDYVELRTVGDLVDAVRSWLANATPQAS
jgi:hypothetical protein